ncbi:hypothetical protein WP12_01330 [Sphingomonas sp. SRS2]|nr:hypothetical protein WP12_01330 [Sphingomonas sp. SRS2]
MRITSLEESDAVAAAVEHQRGGKSAGAASPDRNMELLHQHVAPKQSRLDSERRAVRPAR